MQITETKLKFNGSLAKRKRTKRAIIHHSASPDVPASTIHGWHLGQKWAGIGYHFVIRAGGAIERGRPEGKIGAHSGSAGNVDSIGIVLTGNFQYERPTAAQIESLVWLITQYLEPRYGNLDVIGHKDVMATACPGKLFPWDELRRKLLEGVVDVALDKWMIDGGRDALAYLEKKGLVLNAADWGKEEKLAAPTPQYLFWMLMQRMAERMEGK
jgi:N-acetyl-anhydromuramyl-L-alanine amidase AmpD